MDCAAHQTLTNVVIIVDTDIHIVFYHLDVGKVGKVITLLKF